MPISLFIRRIAMQNEQAQAEIRDEQSYSEPQLVFEGDLSSVTKYWLTEFS